MENKVETENTNINNDQPHCGDMPSGRTIKQQKPKIKRAITEAQKEAQKRYYLKQKADPAYMERQRRSSKTHYYKHKEVVLERMRDYQKRKLELAQIEMLYEIQQENARDLHTGDITQDEYNKIEAKIYDKLAHLHLVS